MDQIRSGWIKMGQHKSLRVRTNEINSGQDKSKMKWVKTSSDCEDKSEQLEKSRMSQNKSCQLTRRQDMPGQVKAQQVRKCSV